MNTNSLKHGQVTEQVIETAYEVHHALGHGFLEKVYENALALHLRHKGLDVEQQAPIAVHYMEQPVGAYFADLLVDGKTC
ncbi:MAG: GxxExxY protein [Mariprofundaceae bacterium]|nr:GxxExxY protein [Mariprofundaceae bacterium]